MFNRAISKRQPPRIAYPEMGPYTGLLSGSTDQGHGRWVDIAYQDAQRVFQTGSFDADRAAPAKGIEEDQVRIEPDQQSHRRSYRWV